ncbi:DUF6153 family protein [Streptomyces sp. NPDC059002]|uniref:DUF6153 family protein n=1 Tax=Streptomyces sp. NPDC059002 TaxID=3346690 RepID=UPI003686FEB5
MRRVTVRKRHRATPPGWRWRWRWRAVAGGAGARTAGRTLGHARPGAHGDGAPASLARPRGHDRSRSRAAQDPCCADGQCGEHARHADAVCASGAVDAGYHPPAPAPSRPGTLPRRDSRSARTVMA